MIGLMYNLCIIKLIPPTCNAVVIHRKNTVTVLTKYHVATSNADAFGIAIYLELIA